MSFSGKEELCHYSFLGLPYNREIRSPSRTLSPCINVAVVILLFFNIFCLQALCWWALKIKIIAIIAILSCLRHCASGTIIINKIS